MKNLSTICVFCGSSAGGRKAYADAARDLGGILGKAGLNLVYGGSNIGLMGIVSAAVRDAGGRVTGVIPEKIAAHVPHQGGITLEVVPGMHERKRRMYEMADGFIALPGGAGTLEELFEAWTWTQLGYHSKPVALLNTAGFYDELYLFLTRTAAEGFLRNAALESLIFSADAETILEKMAAWSPPRENKWDGVKPSS